MHFSPFAEVGDNFNLCSNNASCHFNVITQIPMSRSLLLGIYVNITLKKSLLLETYVSVTFKRTLETYVKVTFTRDTSFQ